MIRYLLDTNICIYLIRKKPLVVIDRIRRKQISQIGISSITLSELVFGIAKSSRPEQNEMALAQFLAPLDILPYDSEAARHYGRLRFYLEKEGTPIGPLDTLIAAHALSLRCILVTNNEKEFQRVPALLIENWTR
ncbi:VapC toxin protein [Olavius algarvensis associated proteobacterium Delta 3]|nr:VapC toxin protein [Olavius algarvensis associated proteobacterium Delta 3]